MGDQMTLAELAEASGYPARTIRFYIARGILRGPNKGGRGAAYGPEHLARLEQIKRLQAEGSTLADIGGVVDGRQAAPSGPPATAWWQHQVAEDVTVWVRADLSPWRTRQVRAAIDEFAGRLRASENEKRKE